MKILVTGGAGFIGSHLVEHFQAEHDVVVVDSLRTGFRDNLTGFRHAFHEVSITDYLRLLPLFAGVDWVFHLAAMVSVPESLEDPAGCVKINTLGTLNVLEASLRQGVKRVVFASSAAVYGDNPKVPKRESMLPEPKTPYAVTKLDGEYYLRMYREQWELGTAALRFFNVFGPRQDPKSHYAAAIPIFIHRALSGQDLVIFGDGTQVRDFIYVKDVVTACVLAAEKGGEVCNVASGGFVTILDIASRIVELTGSCSRIVHADPRPGDIHTSYADIARITRLGFRPISGRDEGLAATIGYFEKKFR